MDLDKEAKAHVDQFAADREIEAPYTVSAAPKAETAPAAKTTTKAVAQTASIIEEHSIQGCSSAGVT